MFPRTVGSKRENRQGLWPFFLKTMRNGLKNALLLRSKDRSYALASESGPPRGSVS